MAAHKAPPSLGFSRQEHWSGLPFPSPKHACILNHFSCVQLCVTPWTAAHQDPLSTGFSRQAYWSGLPFPSPYTPRVNPNSSHRLWVMIMCQCRFFNCSKCTTLVYDVYSREGCVHVCACVYVCACMEARDTQETLYFRSILL